MARASFSRPRRRPPSPGEPATAARILRAADALLAERGYDGVSTRDVARRAGVNKALIFYHFGSKDELFEAVLDLYYEEHARVLATAFEGEGTTAERIHRMVDAYVDFIDTHRTYPRLVQHEILRGGARVEKIRHGLAMLHDWLARALAGLVPQKGPLSPKHFFVSFAGLVINYFTYTPALETLWGEDPMSAAARDERRRHLHWMVDAILEKLARPGQSGSP